MCHSPRRFIGALAACLVLLPVPLAHCLQPPPAAGSATATVSLRASATVTNPKVCLGDIASIVSTDESLRRQLAELDLADLSTGGAAAPISRQQVEFRIRLAGVAPDRFLLQGAAQVHVLLAMAAVSPEEVLAAARRLVLQRLPWKPEAIVIRQVGSVLGLATLHDSTEHAHLDAELSTKGLPLGRVRVDVSAYANGLRRETVPVELDVMLLQRVALAARRIERGEVLTEDKLRFDQRPVDRLDNYVASADSIVGKRARIVLTSGQLISATEVETALPDNPILIHAGDVVHLLANLGPLRVTAMGQAMQDGRAGQLIRVRNVDSNHMILGRVRDRETVEVNF